jgi:hypothetical protein
MRYANLAPWQCRKELTRRKLPFKRLGPTRGIATAVLLNGPLNGVEFITAGKRSPFSRLDCRLALVLDDFTRSLAQAGVKSVRVDNFYRLGARLPGSRRRSQHGYGLAMDVTEFTLVSGAELDIEDAWGSAIGNVPCGPDAPLDPAHPEALTLRNLVCAFAGQGFFHHILTPCHDLAHRNHLHLDIKRGGIQTMIR